MRRRLKQLALFLVLGAVINYSLAIGFIWFGPVRERERKYFRFQDVPATRFESIGMTRLEWWPTLDELGGWVRQGEPGEPPAWSRLHSFHRPPMSLGEWQALPDSLQHDDIAAGWPLRSVRYDHDFWLDRPVGEQFIIQSGIELPPRQVVRPEGTYDQPRAIPLRILPLGFAINTLLFASLAAIVWFAPPAIRRIRRRRANRCLKCGYSRDGLAPSASCPECGTPSSTAKAERTA